MIKIMLGAYLAFWFALALKDVGKLPTVTGPYEWWLPFALLAMIAIPALLGYIMGLGETED